MMISTVELKMQNPLSMSFVHFSHGHSLFPNFEKGFKRSSSEKSTSDERETEEFETGVNSWGFFLWATNVHVEEER